MWMTGDTGILKAAGFMISSRSMSLSCRKLCGAMIVLLLVAASTLSPSAQEAKLIRLAAGPETSLYSRFGDELVDYLESGFAGRYSFEAVRTDGSVENIERLLLEQDIMLAICQEDVALFFYTGADNEFFHFPRQDDFRLTSLARVFYEQLYFVARPEIQSLEDLRRVHVGAQRSGSYATYTTFRDNHRPTWEETQEGEGIDSLFAGTIDAFVEVEATPNQRLSDRSDAGATFRILPVQRRDLSLGLDIYTRYTIPDSMSPTGEPIETISVPALLLCSRDLPRELAESILRVFYDDAVLAEHFPKSQSYLRQIPEDLREPGPLEKILSSFYSDFEAGFRTPTSDDSRFRDPPLPPHPTVVSLTLGRYPYLSFIPWFLGLGLLWLLAALLPRWVGNFRSRLSARSTTRVLYRTMNFLFVALLYMLVVANVIKILEIGELVSGRVATGSAFVEMRFLEYLTWFIVFGVSGFEDYVFPVSPLAKVLAVSVQLLGIGLLGYAGIRLFKHYFEEILRRRTAMHLGKLSGHVVIFNWNERVPQLIELLRAPGVPKERRGRKILIVTEDKVPESVLNEFDNLEPVRMAPCDHATLTKISISKADSIIIVLPGNGASPEDDDGIVLRTALAISSFLDSQDLARKPTTVAEVHQEASGQYLTGLGIDEVVFSREIGMHLLGQTVVSPGITRFFDEILDPTPDSNEIYTVPIPERFHDKDADFGEIIRYYWHETSHGRNPVLPIGVRLSPRQMRDETAEQEEVVLVNPTPEELQRRTFRKGDQLLVLAENYGDARAVS
jgi:TRAP transporter TAXI family solute receptor